MSPFVWKLCATPVLGLLAWAANLCAIPPLIEVSNVSLAPATCSIDAGVTTPVPVRKGYQPLLTVRQVSTADTVKSGETVQSERAKSNTTSKRAMGDVPQLGPEQRIRFKVTVTGLADGRIVSSSIAGLSSRTAYNPTMNEYKIGGLIGLVPGRYHIEVCTLREGLKDPASIYDIAIR